MTKYPDCIGDKLEGYACRFLQRAVPGRFMGRPGGETITARGAFTRSLLEGDCELCYAEHGGRVAASTQSGTLLLTEKEDGLHFVAWPQRTLAGWLLLRDVASGAMREVSFSACPEEHGVVGSSRVVLRYTLHDVCICEAGAQRGCTVKLTTKAELAAERAARVARAAAESAAAGRAAWLPARLYVALESRRPYRAV